MAIELWLAFALASCVLLIIPGPTILTVISYSVAHGNRANIPLIAAVALGDSTALMVSLAGLGAVLATSAWLFTLPQFINHSEPAAPQLWILSITFVVLATLNATLYAMFAASARQLLLSEKAQRRFNIGGGSLMMMAGAWALTAKQMA